MVMMQIHVVGVKVLLRSTDTVIVVHVLVRVRPLSLIRISVPIAIPITMDVHREEIVVQRSTCGGIGAKWYVAIIPIVNVLDSLSLI